VGFCPVSGESLVLCLVLGIVILFAAWHIWVAFTISNEKQNKNKQTNKHKWVGTVKG
jgi:flagellar basal body-associated protein FliL